MEHGVFATWHDGQTAKAHPVLLRFRPHTGEVGIFPLAAPPSSEARAPGDEGRGAPPADDPALYAAEPAAVWNIASTRLMSGSMTSPPLRFAPVEDDGQRLALSHIPSIAGFLAWWEGPNRMKRRRTAKRWAVAGIALWVLIAGFYYASPMIFGAIAEIIPPSWEERLGKSARDQFIAAYAIISRSGADPVERGSAAVDQLMERLTSGMGTKDYHFTVTVLDSSLVNALALPGGYIIVFSGLIGDCQGPDELAGVLAHEMAHVTERHGLSMYLQNIVWDALVRLTGTSETAGGKLGGLALAMMNSSYSRSAEKEADLLAVERLTKAGINPDGLIRFFDRLDKRTAPNDLADQLFSYFSSHPPLNERSAYIHKAVAGYGAQDYTPALPPGTWEALRKSVTHKGADL